MQAEALEPALEGKALFPVRSGRRELGQRTVQRRVLDVVGGCQCRLGGSGVSASTQYVEETRSGTHCSNRRSNARRRS